MRTVPSVRPRRGEAAQSLVEFSLMLPVLLILVFGIIDFGMGLRAYISVSQATREGARYAAVGNAAGTFTAGGVGECNGSTNTTTVGKVCSTLDGLKLSDIQSVSVTYPNGQAPGNSVHVSVSYSYHYITPIQGDCRILLGGEPARHPDRQLIDRHAHRVGAGGSHVRTITTSSRE